MIVHEQLVTLVSSSLSLTQDFSYPDYLNKHDHRTSH
jgi:hypothetical protein